MCGICGVIDFKGQDKVNETLLKQMCAQMEHRGPDGEGTYINCSSPVHAGLGHRRLKIIDLSEAGKQPMSNEDGSICITFNGEIYNFQELRKELEKKGHIFKSSTDTEVIIHLYEEYAEDCVKYLRGMFAFALWDNKNRSLFLARDRVGKKPLLYYHNKNFFCFASEFTSILASGLISKEINYEAIHYYLTFGYIPAPLSVYKHIFKLMPGECLLLKDGELELSPYWQLDYSNKIKISEEDASGEVLRLLKEAVGIRLYSDVPLGAFLSGGIDSSTVVALMSELSGRRVKTFSIGFQENRYDELGFARNIAKKFNTEHHEFIVKPDALRILPLLVERYGEPYADSSCIPTYYVSQQTRQYVTVALNGDGGDELFAGYERYQAMLLAQKLHRLPLFARKIISGSKFLLPDSVDPKNTFRRLKRFLSAAFLSASQRYLKWVSIFDDELKKQVYSDDFLISVFKSRPSKFINPFLNNEGTLNVDSCLRTDMATYLPNDLLVKVDITSMANSLEARSPFLDLHLMEFVARLPVGYKLKGKSRKYLLKKSIHKFVPAENINRRKMGFGVPVGEWFRNELKKFLCETLLSDTCLNRRFFKPDSIKAIIKQHLEMKADYSYQLWTFLMLELWHRRFID